MEQRECLTGAKEIADFLRVSTVTLYRMRKRYPDMPCKKLVPGGLSADRKRLKKWRDKKISG